MAPSSQEFGHRTFRPGSQYSSDYWMRFCKEHGLVPSMSRWGNCCDNAVAELKADRKRTRHLSFEQYQVVLDCCEEWLKGIVTVAAWTGLRQGNIVSLKRDQVNIFARTISVDGSETKNGENLSLPIAEPALEAIKEAMKAHHFKSLFIFCQKDGKPYHKRVVQKGFKAALEKAGIEDFRFHDLRHCFASWNRQAGVDIDTLADLMGHKDTRMTRRYAHINQAHLTSAIGKLEESYRKFSTF